MGGNSRGIFLGGKEKGGRKKSQQIPNRVKRKYHENQNRKIKKKRKNAETSSTLEMHCWRSEMMPKGEDL